MSAEALAALEAARSRITELEAALRDAAGAADAALRGRIADQQAQITALHTALAAVTRENLGTIAPATLAAANAALKHGEADHAAAIEARVEARVAVRQAEIDAKASTLDAREVELEARIDARVNEELAKRPQGGRP